MHASMLFLSTDAKVGEEVATSLGLFPSVVSCPLEEEDEGEDDNVLPEAVSLANVVVGCHEPSNALLLSKSPLPPAPAHSLPPYRGQPKWAPREKVAKIAACAVVTGTLSDVSPSLTAAWVEALFLLGADRVVIRYMEVQDEEAEEVLKVLQYYQRVGMVSLREYTLSTHSSQ